MPRGTDSFDRYLKEVEAKKAKAKGKIQTADCKRGEHLYETGRISCRLCGEPY